MPKIKIYSPERLGKISLYLTADIIILNFSLLISMSLWYTGLLPGSNTTIIPPEAWAWLRSMGLAATVIGIPVYTLSGMYNNLWKYASIDEVLKIFIATTIIFLTIYFYSVYILGDISLRRIMFLAWTINTILFIFSRFGYHTLRRGINFIGYLLSSKAGCKRVMVVGAGYSGYGVIRDMRASRIRDRMPILVVDDEPAKNNTQLMGVRVCCGTENIPELALKFRVDEIIIAMPSADRLQLKAVIDRCTKTDCELKIMPPISDVSDGMNTVRSVNISDLLYREEVNLDIGGIREYLTGKVILITGGGGSIGSELCRQIAKFEPKLMVILDIYENNAYELVTELRSRYKDRIKFTIRIGSVTDAACVGRVFGEFNPDVVFHAAAHKHVPLMEDSPEEAVKNNVFGTYNVARAAESFGADRFVLLSTDKAVNPTSVMGTTKRITEMIIQSMPQSATRFMAVRFGNVLGSNGSVIPLFKRQIAEGGPVTVTHPDMVRFFMTIPEAARLVLQAAANGESGRIFVLDMGQPVKIDDLARNLIKLSGLRPDKDIEIRYTGLRMGEKLYEELIMGEEKDDVQEYREKIFITKPVKIDRAKFDEQLNELRRLANEEPDRVLEYLHVMVPNFCSSAEIKGGVFSEDKQRGS